MSFDWLSPAERGKFLDFLFERFGIPPSRFDGFVLYSRGDYVSALAKGAAQAAKELEGEDGGIQVAKLTHSGFHKPATRGAQVFGDCATKNVVDLTGADLKALVEGRRVDAPGFQGFVLLRLDGLPIGVGLCREGRLESQLPRSMTEHLVLFDAGDAVKSYNRP